MDNSFLDELEIYFPEVKNHIYELKTYAQEKLWHQLSESLLKFMQESCMQQGMHLIDLYQNFVKSFEDKIDQIKYMQFIIKAIEQIQDDKECLQFLDQIKEKVLVDEQAIILCQVSKGFNYLNLNELNNCQDIMINNSKKLERMNNVESIVYSHLHKLSAAYYKKKNNYEEFYKSSLQFLAYTPETSLKQNQKITICYEMGIACLISKKIYNFSELLEQPIIVSLNQTQEYKWVYSLLKTFNNGDVRKFQEELTLYKKDIDQDPEIRKPENQKTIQEKIRIMAFLELVFTLPKNDRNMTFEQVSKQSQIPENQVEELVMRSMSLQLVKGKIDQINKSIKIFWIMPRVLDEERIHIMRDKLDSWNSGLKKLVCQVEQLQENNNQL